MRIRSAQAEDAALIAACVAMAEGKTMSFFTGEDELSKQRRIMEEFVLSPVPNRHDLAHCHVAEIDGIPAGMIHTFPADEQSRLDTLLLENLRHRGSNIEKLYFEGVPGSYYLSTIGVEPKFRGRGIGTALVQAGIKHGFELGFTQISLLVECARTKARALYERIGLSVLEQVHIGDTDYFRMIAERNQK